jgi:hypothetical protein
MTIGMIIGRRRILRPTQLPTVATDDLLQLRRCRVPPSWWPRRAPSSRADVLEDLCVLDEAARGDLGPGEDLAGVESMTTMIEMKPSSRRIRRSFSRASSVPPTDEPST